MNLWVLDYRMKGIYEMKKGAFTLAEVLLTLAIIGVVAAMTVPSLMTSTEDKKLAAGAKKAYNTLQNAVTLKQAQTDLTPADATDGLMKFLTGDGAIGDKVQVLKVTEGKTTNLVQTPDGIVYVSGDGACGTGEIDSTSYCTVVVDVNGVEGPNYSGAKSGTTPAGATIKPLTLTGTHVSDTYGRTNRDIVVFEVNNMNVYPRPQHQGTMRYIKGSKAASTAGGK